MYQLQFGYMTIGTHFRYNLNLESEPQNVYVTGSGIVRKEKHCAVNVFRSPKKWLWTRRKSQEIEKASVKKKRIQEYGIWVYTRILYVGSEEMRRKRTVLQTGMRNNSSEVLVCHQGGISQCYFLSNRLSLCSVAQTWLTSRGVTKLQLGAAGC